MGANSGQYFKKKKGQLCTRQAGQCRSENWFMQRLAQ